MLYNVLYFVRFTLYIVQNLLSVIGIFAVLSFVMFFD